MDLKITEVDEEKENSSRYYAEELDKLIK